MSHQPEEIRRAIHLLNEIAELCEQATLTGTLHGGAPRVVARYNQTLQWLDQTGAVAPGFFQPLPQHADYGEIGVEARMLASYIKGPSKERERERDEDPGILVRLAPFVRKEDLAEMVRDHMRQGHRINPDLLTQLAPFLDQDMLGELVREHLARTRAATRSDAEPAPQPPRATTEITFAPPPPVRVSVRELLDRLSQPGVSDEERDAIMHQIRNLTVGG